MSNPEIERLEKLALELTGHTWKICHATWCYWKKEDEEAERICRYLPLDIAHGHGGWIRPCVPERNPEVRANFWRWAADEDDGLSMGPMFDAARCKYCSLYTVTCVKLL